MSEGKSSTTVAPPDAALWVWCVEHPCEAAGEIERLRAENAALKRDLICCDQAQIDMVKRIKEVINGQ